MLGRRGLDLVYGGSANGVMGTLAAAAVNAGVHVIGVTPRHLLRQEPISPAVGECHLVDTMHERKSLMYELSDAFVALPGGFGTLDELFETLTWSKLGLHRKPVVVLNVDGYFDTLLKLLDHATAERFLTPADRDLVRAADSVPAVLDLIGPGAAETVGTTTAR